MLDNSSTLPHCELPLARRVKVRTSVLQTAHHRLRLRLHQLAESVLNTGVNGLQRLADHADFQVAPHLGGASVDSVKLRCNVTQGRCTIGSQCLRASRLRPPGAAGPARGRRAVSRPLLD